MPVQNPQIASFFDKYTKPSQYTNPLYTYNTADYPSERYTGSSLNNNLGFSPFWDNENRYYKAQSAWDAIGNGMAQLGHIAMDAFANNFQQYSRDADFLRTGQFDKLWLDDNSQAIEDRRQKVMEEYPIFKPNEQEVGWGKYVPFAKGSSTFYGELLGNLGYTVGTIGSVIAENAALSLLTAGSGNVAMAGKSGNAVYRALKALVSAGKPLENLAGAANSARRAASFFTKTKDLTIEGAKRAFSAYRLYHMSAAEAAMEATMGYTQQKADLTDYYKSLYGKDPDHIALQEIDENAKSVGTSRFAQNLAILGASNYVQFKNLLRPFRPSQVASKEVTERLTLAGAQGQVRDIAVRNEFRALSRDWLKQPAEGLKKFRGFFTEGMEELSQNIVDKQTRDYYGNIYKKGAGDFIESMKGAVYDNLSKEGFENFLSGALIGGISGVVQKYLPATKKQKKIRDDEVQKAADRLNLVNVRDFIKPAQDQLANQISYSDQMEQANQRGDVYTYQNFKDQAFRDFVISSIQFGKFDARMDQLNDMKSLQGDAFNDVFGFDDSVQNKKTATEYVDGLINKANALKQSYEKIDSQLKNPFRPQNFIRDTPEYLEEKGKYDNFEKAKGWLLNYSDRAAMAQSRQESIYQDLERDFGFSKNWFTNILDDNFRRKNIELLNAQDTLTSEQQSELVQLQDVEAWRNSVGGNTSIIDALQENNNLRGKAIAAVKEYLNLKYGGLNLLQLARVRRSPLASIINPEADVDQKIEDLVKLYDDQNAYLNQHSRLSYKPIFDSLVDRIGDIQAESEQPINPVDPTVVNPTTDPTLQPENQFIDNLGRTVTVDGMNEDGSVNVTIETTNEDGSVTTITDEVEPEDLEQLQTKGRSGDAVIDTTLGTSEQVNITGETPDSYETEEGVTIPKEQVVSVNPAPRKTAQEIDRELREEFNNVPPDAPTDVITRTISRILNTEITRLPKNFQKELFYDILTAGKEKFAGNTEVQSFLDDYADSNQDRYPITDFVYSSGRVQFFGNEPVNDAVVTEGETKQEYISTNSGSVTELTNALTGQLEYSIYRDAEGKTTIQNNLTGKERNFNPTKEIYSLEHRPYKDNDRFLDIPQAEFDSPDFTRSSVLRYTTKLGGAVRFITAEVADLRLKITRGLSSLNNSRMMGKQRKEVFLTPSQQYEARRGKWQIGFSRVYDADITIHVPGSQDDGLSRDFIDHLGLTTWVVARVNPTNFKIEVFDLFDPKTVQKLGKKEFLAMLADQIKISGKGLTESQFDKLKAKYEQDKLFRQRMTDLFNARIDTTVPNLILDETEMNSVGVHIEKRDMGEVQELFMVYDQQDTPVAPVTNPPAPRPLTLNEWVKIPGNQDKTIEDFHKEQGAKPKSRPPASTTNRVTLPSDLKSAKPRYSFGEKKYQLDFASDVDKSAYIAAQDKLSKRDADFVQFAMRATGRTETEVREYGRQIRDRIKDAARLGQGGLLRIEEGGFATSIVGTPVIAPVVTQPIATPTVVTEQPVVAPAPVDTPVVSEPVNPKPDISTPKGLSVTYSFPESKNQKPIAKKVKQEAVQAPPTPSVRPVTKLQKMLVDGTEIPASNIQAIYDLAKALYPTQLTKVSAEEFVKESGFRSDDAGKTYTLGNTLHLNFDQKVPGISKDLIFVPQESIDNKLDELNNSCNA